MRKKWIDTAKGIAILLVIIGHVSGGLQGIISFQFVYGVHLAMFFVLSGYTTQKKDIDRVFLNKRFSRLMIPYFFTCAAVMLTDVFNSYAVYHDGSVTTVTGIIKNDLLRSFFASGTITSFGKLELGTRIGAIWYLPAMFFATLFIQLGLNYENKDSVLGGSMAILALFGYISARFIWLPFSIQSGMMGAFFIWVGYEIRKKDILSQLKWYHYVLAQILFLVGIFCGLCNIDFVVADMPDIILSTIAGLSGCLLIYGISQLYTRNLLPFIGRISLTVLCTHLYALEAAGVYVERVLDQVGLFGNSRAWTLIIVEVLFAVLIACIIEYLKKKLADPRIKNVICSFNTTRTSRDITVDIAKGIFIVSMIIGHYPINEGLRSIIFSCHMTGFIFLSGYFYKSDRSFLETAKRMVKAFLIPYGTFALGDFLLNWKMWSLNFLKDSLIRYGLGMSFSDRIFHTIPTVGPVYFILMLFSVKLIYKVIDSFFLGDELKWFMCIGVSLFGVFLGKKGLWLPWSFDVACYSLIFYKLGLFARKKDLLYLAQKYSFSYFFLSPVWVYMIYLGGMEIAVRKYGQYGLVVVGSTCGIVLINMLSGYIRNHLPILGRLLHAIGESSIYILIIHAFLGWRIDSYLPFFLAKDGFLRILVSTAFQILVALLVRSVIIAFRNKNERKLYIS